MKRIALLLALATTSTACAPTIRYGFKRCPTVYASLADFTLTATMLAISVLKYNRGDKAVGLGYAGVGMTIALASNIAECKR